jgi:putative adenylate-forming enzyme
MVARLLNRIPGYIERHLFLLFYLLCRIRFRFYSIDQIEDYQKRRASGQIRYVLRHSRFFRSHYRSADLNDFSSLPVVNKKIMMENLTDYNTVGLTKEEIMAFCLEIYGNNDFKRRLKGLNVGMSSGTSGNKGVEIVTPVEERYMKAALFARFDFPKGEKLNLAFILRVTSPAFSIDFLGHKLTWVSQLSDIDTIRKSLEKIGPNVLSAPPSMLKIIASEAEAGRLTIKPSRIVSYAEVLHPDVKDYLGRIFNCQVHEIYKCTEGPIAISCKSGSLHINEDMVLVETLDDDGSVTRPGKPCHKMIITDLHKRSQPIIRYELNDIITISPEKCRCGSSFRVIERIQGRADDIFWSRSSITGEWQYIFPDYISRAIISSSDDIDEFQVVQESPSLIRVILKLREVPDQKSGIQEAVKQNIKDLFSRYNCVLPDISVEPGNPEPNSNSQKLIRIYRNFNPKDYDRTKEN